MSIMLGSMAASAPSVLTGSAKGDTKVWTYPVNRARPAVPSLGMENVIALSP
jgi:hypothetical protein